MTDLRELAIEDLPGTPNPNCWWKLEREMITDVLSESPANGGLPRTRITEDKPTGYYELHLMELEESAFSQVLTTLSDSHIVAVAKRLVIDYTSRNRAKALEEGPLNLVPARKNNAYVMPC